MSFALLFSSIYTSILTSLFATLIFAPSISAVERNCASKNYAPLCPDSGATILDETYPTQAFVVSVSAYSDRDGREPSEKLPADFITSVLESYSTNRPDIFVPAEKENFLALLKTVEKKLLEKMKTPSEIKEQLALIKHIENDSYTWQQDYFESFVSIDTGNPLVRSISSYREPKLSQATIDGLKAANSECPIETGDSLKEFKKDESKNAEMGGNIEGLPGGLCLMGDNQTEFFASQYCAEKKKGNHVEIDVSWLNVGHVDEIVKVIPKFPKSNPQECNFTVMLASPKVAFEVLKLPEYLNRDFIDRIGLNEEEALNRLSDIENSKAGFKFLCTLLEKFDDTKTPAKSSTPKDKNVKQVNIWKVFQNLSIESAFAGVVPVKGETHMTCSQALGKVTNKQILELMEKDEEFMLTNKLIQEKMEKNKITIKNKLQQRLPQCKNITFLEVPDLFYGHGLAEVNGQKQLPANGVIRSLLPNPTNSVLANQTMIVSDTHSSAFNQFLERKFTTQGLKSKFVNTWNYAHAGDGNLHCATHSITYCKPRGKK